jgi:hypothetical protein
MKLIKEKKLHLVSIIFFYLTVTSFSINLGQIDNLVIKHQNLTLEEKLVSYSTLLLNKSYKENVLIGSASIDEKLTIDLNNLDCFTYVEYVYALALSSSQKDFRSNLISLRYDDNTISYFKRNHFFTNWADDNNLKRVSDDKKINKILNKKDNDNKYLKGIPLEKKIIYYEDVNDRDYAKLKDKIYIVGILSSSQGLDVSHVGFLIINNDELKFRHASSKKKYRKVVDEDFLEYIENKPGIIIYKFVGANNGRFN